MARVAVNRAAFDEMIATQDSHWWFRGRRAVVDSILSSLSMPDGANILEIGCGAGGNLRMLSRYGRLWALELDDYARDYAAANNKNAVVRAGWLPDGLEAVAGCEFDLICLFDVLEHIEDDEGALRNITPLLGHGAKILATVPAYQWLYSSHDRLLSHFRRYGKRELSAKFRKNGYRINYAGYLNVLSLPLMIISRLFDILRKAEDSAGTGVPARPINEALFLMFRLESLFVPKISAPFGGSVVVCAEKAG
jgi:SAM-dependent methyltransferase